MSCEKKPAPKAYSTLSDCDKLAAVEDALMALATGKARRVVRHGEYWVENHPGGIPFLTKERDRLQALCDRQRGVKPRHHAIGIGRTIGGWHR